MNYYFYSLMAISFAIFVFILMIQEIREHTKKEFGRNPFLQLSAWVVFYCVQDAVWGISASDLMPSRLFLFISSFSFHISATITAYFWVKYVKSYFKDANTYINKIEYLSVGVIVGEMVLLIINCFYPLIYEIDENVVYHTGILRSASYFFQYAIYVLIGIFAFVSWVREKGQLKHKHLSVLMFVLAPCIGGFIQALYPNAPFYALGYSIGCFIIYSFIISRERRELLVLRSKNLEIIQKQADDLLFEKLQPEACQAKLVLA